MKTYIKAPDGRIVAADRSYFVEKQTTGGLHALVFDEAKLKTGWAVALPAEVKALEDAEAKRVAAEKGKA